MLDILYSPAAEIVQYPNAPAVAKEPINKVSAYETPAASYKNSFQGFSLPIILPQAISKFLVQLLGSKWVLLILLVFTFTQ